MLAFQTTRAFAHESSRSFVLAVEHTFMLMVAKFICPATRLFCGNACVTHRVHGAACFLNLRRISLDLQDGFTALHRSCVTGNVRVIAYLISKGSGVNIEDTVSNIAAKQRAAHLRQRAPR